MALNTVDLSNTHLDTLQRVKDLERDSKMRNGVALQKAMDRLKKYMDNDPSIKSK